MNKQVAEFIGTFALVFFGCGAAVVGGMGSGATAVDLLGIASAFGFAIVAMAYGIGPISGCHVNPAVSFGVYVAGRMSVADMISYWIAQVLGAIVAAVVLYLILSGKAQGWTGSLGQNGWAPATTGNTMSFPPSCSKWWRHSCSWCAFSASLTQSRQPASPVSPLGSR
jgi:aquaporin Z